ncbi:hypothetical protein [Nocardia sp. NPDC052566]|uniref:hypothetical protein n=1 Tax=Nocardia sp. NPDC052566 TaxID=3364330 RepID=UPI0037C87D0A
MASGGPGLDQTDWSGLLKGARDGKLTLGVDVAKLKVLIDACEVFVADISGLVNAAGSDRFPKTEWVYDNRAADAPATAREVVPARVTTLGSMEQLFVEFDRKRTVELVDVLKNHQAIVTVMANTFTAACKSYSKTDGDNAGMFSPRSPTDHWPEIFKHHATPTADWKSGPGLPTTAGSGVSFDPKAKGSIENAIETGYNLEILDFANIAEMFVKNDGNIFWIAGEWQALADIWRSSVRTFVNQVEGVFRAGAWEGVGADRAVAFLEKYLQSTDTLQRGMVSMSNVIGNTANFNSFMWSRLAHYSFIHLNADKTIKDVDGADAADYLSRQHALWDKGDSGTNQKSYVGGIKQLAGLVPVFTDPNKLAGSDGGLPGTYNYKKPTGDDNGNKDKSGGGGGTGGGGDKSGGGKSGGATGDGGSKGGGEGAGSGGGKSGKSSGKPPGSGGAPQSSSRTPSSGSANAGPGGATGPTGGATGPLSALSKALQQLASGMMSGPLASGPWGVSGPTGASGPFGFDIKPAGAGGGSAGGGAAPGKPANPLEDKLFPRAGATGNTTESVAARAGIAPSAAMPYGGGYPMGGGMGGAPGGQQQQQQQRKRAAYLDSTEHLEEAVGEDPLSVRPVIDR